MTNERKTSTRTNIHRDIGRRSGRFASCISSFSRKKKIIVFDEPEPPRNAASRGVHGFLGLDRVLPTEIRKIAWKQIDKYDSAGIFFITTDNETSIKAKKVVLAGIKMYIQASQVFSNVGQI
jgi:hypothetical protein